MFIKRWYELVAAYSNGELTYPTDKLIALSGVADLVQRQVDIPYLAWNWGRSDTMAPGLLWVIRAVPLRERRTQYCAPSWSWASADGRVDPLTQVDYEDYRNIRIVANVEQAAMWFQGKPVKSARSLVDDGMLRITGPAAKVRFSPTLGKPGYSLLLASRAGWNDLRLRFFPDWQETTVQEARLTGVEIPSERHTSHLTGWERTELLAVQVMSFTKPMSVSWRSYRIVVRERHDVSGQFERVGVFQAEDSIQVEPAQEWNFRDITLR